MELLVGLEGGNTSTERRGAGRIGTGTAGGKGAVGGSGGGESLNERGASGSIQSSAWFESDALALAPLFAGEHQTRSGEMNFLNSTSGAMSLAADVAGIASSIGQGGSLAGFLRDLGHTCCSSPASLRQAIRVRMF